MSKFKVDTKDHSVQNGSNHEVEPSSLSITAVDTSSIIQNKETTKIYWESRMMADQAAWTTSPSMTVSGTASSEKVKNGTTKMNGNHEVNGDEQSLNSGTSDKKNQKQQQQELNACVTNGNSTSDQSNTNCNTKNLQTSSTESRRTGGKLGSDGESEASPETSLSPLDVDSMEESDGRISSSADSPPFPSERKINTLTSDGSLARMSYVKSENEDIKDENSSSVSPLLHLVCDALGKSNIDERSNAPKDELFFDPFTNDTINDDNFIVHKVLMNGNDLLDDLPVTNNLMISRSFEEREENLLSTVIEEEHEQDSLEEFIKHETECGCQSSATGSANSYGEKETCCNSIKGPENDHHKRCTAPSNHLPQESVEVMFEINDGQEKEKQFSCGGDTNVCANGGNKKYDLLQDHDQLKTESKKEKVDNVEETVVENVHLNGHPSSATVSLPSSETNINGDGVKKGSFYEPVTSSSLNEASEASSLFESEGICESKVVPSSKLAGSEEGKDKNDEGEGRKMMKKVDNDQHHHDSFKIEKDSSSSSFQNSLRVRTKSLKKKADSIFSEEVTTPPSTVTTVTTPQPQASYTAGSQENIIPSLSLETDVVTQLCFEPVEVLVKDLEPKEQVDNNEDEDDIQVSSKQTSAKLSNTMNGCPISNSSKISSTGAITGNNKSREDMRHAMKPSHSSSITASLSVAADHAMNGKKISSNENTNSSNTNIFKRSSSIKDLREKQNEAEIKIAREILELKQREEELRIMRQEMNRINALRAKEDIKAVPSDVSSVEIDGRCSPSSSEISTTESVSGRISVDSLESHSNCHSNSSSSSTDHHLNHYHNHHNKVKRLSNIKVKPFEEKLDQENVSYFNQGMNSLMKKQESPIEREIRILKEREEELRLEKLKRCQGSVTPNRGACPEGSSSPITPDTIHNAGRPLATNGVLSSSVSSSSSTNGELFPVSKLSNGTTNGIQIQKVLATTRIQQEIEEQTQREMALRACGSIKTISHERTDIKVVPTKLCGPPPVDSVKTSASSSVETKVVPESVKAIPAKVNGSIFESSVSQLKEEVEKKSAELSLEITNSKKPSQYIKNAKALFVPNAPGNGVVIKQIPSSMSSAGVIRKSAVISPSLGGGRGNSISMHKFISSKGKQYSSHQNLSSIGPYPFNSSTENLSNGTSYQDLRPPMFAKNNRPRRGSVSAESKIQEELREMKAREEELRNQRTLARSQSNLLTADEVAAADRKLDTERRHSSLNPVSDGSMKRAYSMSALLTSECNQINGCQVDKNKEDNCETSFEPEFLPAIGRPRIKTSLIAEWESKIHHSEGNSVQS